MLTPHEKWFFDHHGFIILPKVVPPEDIERMIELGNRGTKRLLMNCHHRSRPLLVTVRLHQRLRIGSIISNTVIRYSNGLCSTERLCV